jgi:hypothetical protein
MNILNTCLKPSITLLAISLSMIMLSCGDDNDNKIKEPVIAGFTPASALPGASVTISGNNFSPIAASNHVSFNAVEAAVTSATATELIVTVPEAATTGKIAVTVNGKTATSATDFTVLQTTIAEFSPESGWPGEAVTITGTNFSATPSENVVKFNAIAATVTSASATELVVTVPEMATTGKITVTVNNKTATSSTDFTVLHTTITAFSPESGAHGTEVTITGTSFSATPSENIVEFNGVAATVSAATSTELTVSVPAEATSGKITVTIDGRTTMSATDFTVPPAVITSFFPPIAATGISVAITGTNFSPVAENNTVKFNGVDATVTAASPTELTVTVPAGATAGPLTVEVGLSTATSAENFELCSGSPELVISDVVISNVAGATSYSVSFKITNTGAVDADMTKMVIQDYASADAIHEGNDLAAGGTFLPSASIIAPGQSYTMPNFNASMSGGNTASHPYLVITLFDSPDGSVPECNIDNNIVIKHFN